MEIENKREIICAKSDFSITFWPCQGKLYGENVLSMSTMFLL